MHEFPFLRSANDEQQYECDLPARPCSWSGWRVVIEPTFTFTDDNCVGQTFFDYYSVDTFEETVAKLFYERRTDPIGYRCYALDVTPAFQWYAQWPLLRRSKRGRFVRRRARQGAAPWEFFPDNSLFEVWRRPDGPMGFTWTYMLSVGGRTQQEAMGNWQFWAGQFPHARRIELQRPAPKQPRAIPG